MSKTKDGIAAPDITLAECTRQLGFINENVFQLKQGIKYIIELIEKEDYKNLKKVLEIYDLKTILENLQPKD